MVIKAKILIFKRGFFVYLYNTLLKRYKFAKNYACLQKIHKKDVAYNFRKVIFAITFVIQANLFIVFPKFVIGA